MATLEETMEEIPKEGKIECDTRYLGGREDLVTAAMKKLHPEKEWGAVVNTYLEREYRAARLGRHVESVNWDLLEAEMLAGSCGECELESTRNGYARRLGR